MSCTKPSAHERSLRAEVPAGTRDHQIARVASGIRRAARQHGIELSIGFAQEVVADGLRRSGQIGVSRVGRGVVIHTAPASKRDLPILLGYAEAGSAWLRGGNQWSGSPEVAR